MACQAKQENFLWLKFGTCQVFSLRIQDLLLFDHNLSNLQKLDVIGTIKTFAILSARHDNSTDFLNFSFPMTSAVMILTKN
jgi:hypothetical protein